ncbi:hypothetical protein LTR17_024465 [Elasticomyces elasticus]|nr:hypothetical protein LTR17_024465 [Elasticomyces elasticus]
MAVESKYTQSQSQGDKVAKKPTATMQAEDEKFVSSPVGTYNTKASDSEHKAALRVDGAHYARSKEETVARRRQ